MTAIVPHVHVFFTVGLRFVGVWRGGLWSWRWGRSSPAFPREDIVVAATVRAVGGGGGAAASDGPGVAALWAGGVLASVCRTSMVKRIQGARGVGLLATLGGVAEAVAIVALGVSVSVDGLFNLELLREEEEGREDFLYVVGVDGDNHRSRWFGYSRSSVLVKVPGRTDLDRFGVED